MRGSDVLRTQFSLQASDMAAAFNKALSKCRVTPGDYVPELTAPDGPSTGGGVQAGQRLRLVPKQPGFPTLVVGSTDPKAGTAELRTYDYLDTQNRHRFKKPLALDRAEYEKFLDLAKTFLGVLKLKVSIESAPSPETLDAFVPPSKLAAEPSGSGKGLAVTVAFIAAALVAVAAIATYVLVLKK